ncbi:MAG: F0F1 ATP synthase subunit epsilon [Ignavibacteriae bacterium]|nr:F0F1 ATP synthase subunit epsilon [Ignavibacteriota bacterium]
MADKNFQREIVTPQRVVFKGDVESFTAPGSLGSFQVLVNHAPLLSAIGVGETKMRDKQGNEIHYATSGGFVEVMNNRVVMLAESAECSNEIDVSRAEKAKSRAKDRLEQHPKEIDVERARAALARAMNRLKIAGRA